MRKHKFNLLFDYTQTHTANLQSVYLIPKMMTRDWNCRLKVNFGLEIKNWGNWNQTSFQTNFLHLSILSFKKRFLIQPFRRFLLLSVKKLNTFKLVSKQHFPTCSDFDELLNFSHRKVSVLIQKLLRASWILNLFRPPFLKKK